MTFTTNEQNRVSTLLIRCFARGRSVGDLWVVCMAKAKWLTKPNAGAYVGRSAMMYCPPREASATLPAAPCFPRFLGKHARLGMSRAAPSARLLPAAPCHSRLPGNFWPPPAIPSPSAWRLPASCASRSLGKTPTEVSQASTVSLAVAANCCRPGCCRQLLPPAAAAPFAQKSVTSVTEGAGQSFKRFIFKRSGIALLELYPASP